MDRQRILVACCVLWLSKCLAISWREFADYKQYIEGTSRLDQHPLRKANRSACMYYEEEKDYAWERGNEFEGDMILNRRQRSQIIQELTYGNLSRNGAKDLSWRWPNKEVIYEIEEDFTPQEIKAIEEGMEKIAYVSCVKFRKYKEGDKYSVLIQGKEPNCFSAIGFQKKRRQLMNLSTQFEVGRGCLSPGTIQHELLHTLGFLHMHSSPNRDKYVRVHWENILPSQKKNFLKYSSNAVTDFGVEYEYYSVMHYSRTAYSRNGKDTLEPLFDPNFNIMQRKGMTRKDIKKLNLMYCK